MSITHKVEYLFGYDLRSGAYDVRPAAKGIEVHVGKPTLLGAPAVTDLKYEVLVGGIFTDEKAAVIKLYESASARAKQQGLELAKDSATIALCEKKLIEFLHDFLAKQPGVRVVPSINVVYK